eukprot:TRINITY_DN15432_c0_g1_i1.p1 TRINITY_DN15432_c0_g1~~TRINITY_DN15432_c0_g1_i1.p1  ORF type:complete len:267 (-),score=53.63 TRINITY_DN15432_c0_g1_i1:100-900(-)
MDHNNAFSAKPSTYHEFDRQLQRILNLRRILAKSQTTTTHDDDDDDELRSEIKKGIPSLLRADIWSSLLGVKDVDECKKEYEKYDTMKEGIADKQIELDIPRCHQYHDLLASPSGHLKFKRILKAWVMANKENVYWQGLDSTLAPFLALYFTDEARAFSCLQRFMKKYLQSFYTKDNTLSLQGYLTVFRQLTAYHDPLLAFHLYNIDFEPDLYAIPWFLTSFTHIFPLQRVYPLFDFIFARTTRIAAISCYFFIRPIKIAFNDDGF